MNAPRYVRTTGFVMFLWVWTASPAPAVDTAVTDKVGQTMTLHEAVFKSGNSEQPILPLQLAGPGHDDSNTVECSLQAVMLKEIVPDPAARSESGYRVKLLVTLTDGQQYRGEATGSIAGESDLGKATVEFDKLARAAFSRTTGNVDFSPEAGAVRAEVVDRSGNHFDITAASVATGRQERSNNLPCALGAISLSVPLETIAKIENLGEVKVGYSTTTKLRLTLVSGRSLEVTTGSENGIAGPFKYGNVRVPFSALATATLEKKK